MGRIVDYRQETQPSGQGAPLPVAHAPQSGLAVWSARAFETAGDALDTGSKALRAVEDEEGRAWAASAVSQARLEWTQKLSDAQTNAEPNAPGFTPKMLADFDEYSGKAIENAPTRQAKRFYGGRLMELRSHIGEKSIQFESQARLDWRVDQFTQGIDNSRKLMNTDPSQYKIALGEQLAIIDEAAIDPVKRSALRQKAIDEISSAAVWSQIQKSPGQFLAGIGYMGVLDPVSGKTRATSGDLKGVTGNAAFDMLPFDKRVQLFEKAVQFKAQIDMDGDRASKEERKQLGDNALKDIWTLHADNKLTRAAVEQRKMWLTPDQYHSALKALPGADGNHKSDPTAFRDVERLIANNQFTEASDLAFKYHAQGRLSNEHLSGQVNRARSQERQETPKSVYETTRAHLFNSLDPGAGVHDPLGKSRSADALKMFDDWNRSGKRSDTDIEKRGSEIIDQFRFFDLRETLLALPTPRGIRMRRDAANPALVTQDILSAGKELQSRYDSGGLTESEYKQEMATLNRWRKAIETKK